MSASATPRSDSAKRYFTQEASATPLFDQDPEIAWVPLADAQTLERELNELTPLGLSTAAKSATVGAEQQLGGEAPAPAGLHCDDQGLIQPLHPVLFTESQVRIAIARAFANAVRIVMLHVERDIYDARMAGEVMGHVRQAFEVEFGDGRGEG